MKHFILTGAPGAGKTAIVRQLEVLGHPVVEEAATDVIALRQARGDEDESRDPAFVDAVVAIQERRRLGPMASNHHFAFHDRSPICSLALARFLGFEITPGLAAALARIEQERFYQRRVFLVRNLGFIVNTAARRISFEDTVRFERVHEETYLGLGYDLAYVEPGAVLDRARSIVDTAVRTL